MSLFRLKDGTFCFSFVALFFFFFCFLNPTVFDCLDGSLFSPPPWLDAIPTLFGLSRFAFRFPFSSGSFPPGFPRWCVFFHLLCLSSAPWKIFSRSSVSDQHFSSFAPPPFFVPIFILFLFSFGPNSGQTTAVSLGPLPPFLFHYSRALFPFFLCMDPILPLRRCHCLYCFEFPLFFRSCMPALTWFFFFGWLGAATDFLPSYLHV